MKLRIFAGFLIAVGIPAVWYVALHAGPDDIWPNNKSLVFFNGLALIFALILSGLCKAIAVFLAEWPAGFHIVGSAMWLFCLTCAAWSLATKLDPAHWKFGDVYAWSVLLVLALADISAATILTAKAWRTWTATWEA